MPFPTVTVTPGSGQTINTLPNAGQATSANSLPVVVASDQSSLPISGTVTANAGGGTFGANVSQVGGSAVSTAASGVQKVGISGNAGAAVDAAGQNAASPANELIVGGQFNTTPAAITSGNVSPLQLDSSGNLKVNVAAGGSSGGTSSSFNAAFPSTGTAAGLEYLSSAPALTSGNMAAFQGDVNGNLKVNLQTALPAGSNVIGTVNLSGISAGLNYETGAIVPTIQASAYAAGNNIGGLQTVSFFRTTGQPSALIDNLSAIWLGGETTALTFFLFNANPSSSTITDKSAFVLANADIKKLIAAPFTVTPNAVVGNTQTCVSYPLNVSAVNQDIPATANIYVVIVVNGAVTPAVGDLVFMLNGIRD